MRTFTPHYHLRSAITFLLVIFGGTVACSQQTVNGTVLDEATRQGVPNVSVTIKGTTKGTTTNSEGNYTITKENENTILVFSVIGYATRELRVGAGLSLSINLTRDSKALDDIVVVGYGTQKRSNITAAVSEIKGSELMNRPIAATSMALQGFAPGLTVRQGSGQPGADGGTINIRGIGSVSGSRAPLIVIDGAEAGSLNDIDPNIIESISILKDAASTAVYGVRGTNGVILVKTKRGQSGKTSLAYNSFVSRQDPTNMPKTLSSVDNMILNNEAVSNTGSTVLPYAQTLIDQYRTTPADNFTVYDTDWKDAIFQNTGILQNHNLIVSGGSDKASYLASGTYLDQQGLIVNNRFTKYDLRMNSDINITSKIKFSTDIYYTKATNIIPSSLSPNEIIQRAITMARFFPSKFEEGKYGNAGQSNSINPIGAAESSGTAKTETPTLSMRFSLRAEVFKNFILEGAFVNRTSNTQIVNAGRTYDIYVANPATSTLVASGKAGILDSALTYGFNKGLSNQYYGSATYSWSLANDHHFKVQTGFQGLNTRSESVTATRYGLQYPDRPYLNLATSASMPQVGGSASETALAGFFGRINYDFNEKYLLELTGRYDGASRFARITDKQWGGFGGISAGWIITREDFMESFDKLDFAKLRISYGTLGNQEIVGGVSYPFAARLDPGTAYYFNNVLERGFSLANVPNVNLSWETSNQRNIGVDLAFFKNKLNVTFDYYEKRISDMIVDLPLLLLDGFSSGTNSVPRNLGKMINKGWEFSANYKNRIGQFNYNITANLSDVTNKILALPGGDVFSNILISREGNSVESYNLYQTDGLYQTGENFNSPANGNRVTGAGDIKYVDADKNGQINAADRRITGNNFPRYEYSLNTGLSFKNFDLNVFLYGVGKRDNYISGIGVEPFNAGNWIASGFESVLDRWTPDNPDAKYPRLYSGGNQNYIQSTYWLRNGAFMRVKNITLGYNIGKNIMQKTKLQQFRIYASVVNPFTFSSYEQGFDPEINNNNGAFYPIMRTATLGVNVRF